MSRRIASLKKVTIIKGHVQCLQKNADRVDTLQYIDDENKVHSLTGDIIIDARGRYSNARELLMQLGYTVLSPRIVKNDLGYASRVYRTTKKNTHDFKQIYIQVRPGKITKGVVVSSIENQRMMVTAMGLGDDMPSRDENDFHYFLTQLPCAELQNFLSMLEPVGSISICRNLKNCHSQFGKMKKWPTGFIVIGDAACILNPVYGQGMTVAAKEVMLLKSKLHALQAGYEKSWEHQFQKNIDKLTFLPWLMATTEDQRAHAASNLPFYLRSLHRYFDKVLQLAAIRQDIHALFIKIVHMMKSPYHLFHPRMLMRVFFSSTLKRKI